MKETTKKIGIMGGTFNPIHMGHLLLAEQAREQGALHEILFLPSGISYMKKDRTILDAMERLKLVELSIAGNPYFTVSDMEILRGGYTYTYETIEQLCHENPEVEYSFITGADSLFSIENWKCPERIFAGCSLIVAARNGSDIPKMKEQIKKLGEKYGARVFLLEMPRVDISSTYVRECIKAGKSIRYMVSSAAEEYINKKQLFIQ